MGSPLPSFSHFSTMSDELWDTIQYHFYEAMEMLSAHQPDLAINKRPQIAELQACLIGITTAMGIPATHPPIGERLPQEDGNDDEDEQEDELQPSGQHMPEPRQARLLCSGCLPHSLICIPTETIPPEKDSSCEL